MKLITTALMVLATATDIYPYIDGSLVADAQPSAKPDPIAAMLAAALATLESRNTVALNRNRVFEH